MSLVAIKFQDPDYNGGAVSDGFLDTATGNIIEPGNTNGNTVDGFGWMLAQYQAATAVMDANLAGQVRGECASTGITPESTWEYIGKPLVIMAAAVVGGEALGAAGAASGSTLAPTVISAGAAPVAAAPIAIETGGTITASLGSIGAVGAVAGGGSTLLGSLGAAVATGAEQVGEKVALGAALTALAPKPVASNPIALAPIAVTHKPFPWAWLLGAVAAGGALLLSGAL